MLIEADGYIYYHKYKELYRVISRNFPNVPDSEFINDVKLSKNYSKKFKIEFIKIFKDIYDKSKFYKELYGFEGNISLKKSIIDTFKIKVKNKVILKELRYNTRNKSCYVENIF